MEKQYAEFANHFLTNWSRPALETMLMILNAHRNGVYVSDRVRSSLCRVEPSVVSFVFSKVLFLALSFTNTAVAHSHCWRTMKPHALVCEFTLSCGLNSIFFCYIKIGREIFVSWSLSARDDFHGVVLMVLNGRKRVPAV